MKKQDTKPSKDDFHVFMAGKNGQRKKRYDALSKQTGIKKQVLAGQIWDHGLAILENKAAII